MRHGHLRICYILCIAFTLTLLPICSIALAERIFFAGYNGGFYLKSQEEGGMELRLGGSFQADYRAYAEDERADNRFDIRRARLIFRGRLTHWLRFAMEYEFQGNETNNLVDAYGEWVFSGLTALRFGQFKEPFSLEWQSPDKASWFVERSMGYYLTPQRDIGLMLHGSMYEESLNYAVGFFNGDGDDGSTRGNQHDAPEITGRFVAAPLRSTSIDLLRKAQIGFSASYAKIDTANIEIKVKSTGMAGLTRNLYVLTHDTKFGVLQDIESRCRWGVEGAWAWRNLALMTEYQHLTYCELEPATSQPKDAEFSSWYVSLAYCVTGESLILSQGVMKSIYPDRFFNPAEGTYGALCLAARYNHFSGDEDWITPSANVSVRDADALSLAATWILFPMHRIILDLTKTDFSDRIKARVNPNGSIDYIDGENVITLRMAMDF
jgi:phosphate-selective porin OprO/OprP